MDASATHDSADLVAVVGMAGRFPEARDTDRLWELLIGRGDAIRPIPPERWDTSAPLDPEREIQAVGGLIEGVDTFDAAFFGVSPREAAAIDPQQRLLLEESWRALEDAGQPAAGLAGTRTGVYIGASWHDYELLRIARNAPPTPHSLYGNALDVIAARLSYFYKLRGPSLTVETGCSSSLVALHLAAQALRTGEIDAAIVGGVNLMLDPHVTIGLTHFGALSPDGRCATFSDAANGFVRGEAVAALYLKTLARALADGDRIHAVIARTAVNNDGGGESLVTPSPDGQEDLLRQAYGDGAVPYDAIAYIEAHGTGTGRGDPIETTAIGRVLGQRRTTGPLPVGSIKTNIGHLEAAAGMAGLFKLLLALRHRIVPPSLHSARLNPEIPFDDLNLTVVRDPLPLPERDPIYLGVSSFGWGGTNAHVVVMSPPPAGADGAAPDTATRDEDRLGLPPIVPLSAQQPAILTERADQLRSAVPEDPIEITALAGTLAHRRDHFPVRAAFLATGAEPLRTALGAFAADPEVELPEVVTGRAVPRGRVAFVFPGQGSQWRGMGQQLYRSSPRFAEVIDACAEALRPHVSWDPLAVFTGTADEEWLSRIDMLQPSLWAMSLGLAELWRAAGVTPDVVLGHSQGEITAATLAGILSYEDAALVMARRSAIARRTCGRGLMLAVDLDWAGAHAALEGFEESVSVAVHNGPRSCVLSGDHDSILVIKELLEADEVFCRLVNVDYASHSPQMDELTEDLLAALAPTTPRHGTIELMSTVRVDRLAGPELDAAYWVENLRSPVRFADAMGKLLDEGVTHVVEISPHPVLAPAIEQLTSGRPDQHAVLSTLRRDSGAPADFARALARAYVSGLEPFGGLPRRRPVPAPHYPLRGERYWIPQRQRGSAATRGFEVPLAPAPADPELWHGRLDLSVTDLPWLGDHRVYEAAVLPGAGMLALAVQTARARAGSGPHRIDDVAFHKEVAFGDDAVRLTAEWRDGPAGGGDFRLLSLPEGGGGWVVNATARVWHRQVPDDPSPAFPDWAAATSAEAAEAFYRDCAARGLNYGPAFQGVQLLHRHPEGGEVLGEVVLGDRLRASNRPHVLHPALWDGALQVSLALRDGPEAVVPTAIRRIRFWRDPAEPVTRLWSHAVRTADGRLDVHLFDGDRRPLVSVTGLALDPLPSAGGGSADTARLHHLTWLDVTAPAARAGAPGRWLVRGTPGGLADELAVALAAAGAEVSRADADADRAAPVTTAGAGPGREDGAGGGDAVPDGVVFVAPDAASGVAAQRQGLGWLTSLAGECADLGVPPRLAVVTALAQPVLPGDQPDPGAALYWGYTRVLRREHGELEPRVIDVDPAAPGWAGQCVAELLADDGEDQVALRGARRLAARLVRGDVDPGPGHGDGPRDAVDGQQDQADGQPVRVDSQPVQTGEPDRPVDRPQRRWPDWRARRQPFRIGPPGPDGPRWVPLDRRAPAAGEIEIEIEASLLDEALVPAGSTTGGGPAAAGGTAVGAPAAATEAVGGCAGRVVAVGPEVTGFHLGDRVAALTDGALGSHVTVRADHCQRVPEGMAEAEAAVLPLAMCTAWQALVELGRVEPEETVLVCSAGRPAGLAAVRLARALGARVIVLDQGAARRQRPAGADIAVGADIEIIDADDPDWPDAVRTATGGRGVDIVLNADAGTSVRSGLAVLAGDGRFIQLEGTDLDGGRQVHLDPLRRGVTLAAVDLPGLTRRRPRRLARILDAVWDLVATGKLEPLPVRRHDFAEVAAALRLLRAGGHDGAEVLVDPATVDRVAPLPTPYGRFRSAGTYLVTGGLGALGLSLAEYLAEHGAGALVLLGRSAPDAAAADRVAAMRAGGTRVEVLRCDVTDETALRRALDGVRAALPPLRGVFHTAGLLDDATIRNVTPEQIARVLAPKVDGVRNLDAVTADDPLDLFVLFSSAAGLVGNAGQAAYAAANTYLDAFAAARRSRGLPALSVQWGPFAEVGLAARDEQRGARLSERGMGSFPPHEAWPALVRMLAGDEPVVGYVPIDLRQWFDAYPDTAALKSWERLRATADSGGTGTASDGEFLARVLAAPPSERAELVEAKIRELSGRVLRLDPQRVDRQTPFKALGLDSLMGLELRNRLEGTFGIRLSPTLLWTYGNPGALAGALCERLPVGEGD